MPPLIVDALLFIENRELLDARYPMRNAAIEWDRLAAPSPISALRQVDAIHASPGGSTLATQIEKYRHSPEGRTESVKEKLRQMASASLRTYLDGEYTLAWRRQIVVDYLNTVPLAAQAGFGEVNGLGDGLWAWYGRDFTEINQLLIGDDGDAGPAPASLVNRQALAFKQVLLLRQAIAYKQALSLLIAQRRPSHYLTDGEAGLSRADRQLPARDGRGRRDQPSLRDAALPVPLQLHTQPPASAAARFVERKAATALRAQLSGLLDVPRAYDLDRLDLEAGPRWTATSQRAGHARAARSEGPPAARRRQGCTAFACSTKATTRASSSSASRCSSAAQRPTCCACRPTTSTSRSTSTKARGSTSAPPRSCAR